MMEAGTGGAPAGTDQQTQLQQALDTLTTSVNDMQTRVNGDLETLKTQLQQANQNPAVDLTAVIEQVTTIQETVIAIDAAPAPVQGGAGGPLEPAPTGTDAPAQTAEQGAPAGDAPAPGADATAANGVGGDESTVTQSGNALYTFDGDPSAVDTNEWPRASVNAADGRPLFHYSQDFAPDQQNGDGLGGVWHVYTGDTVPVS